MGEFVKHRHVPHTLAQMNFRFAHGDALNEMVAFQKHFEVFSNKHPVKRSFSLVNVAPHDERERRGFFRYLDRLKNVGSNVAGLDGHAALVTTLKKNLESKTPLPVHFTVSRRSARRPEGEGVDFEALVAFSKVKYLTISLPTFLPEA